jgi:alkylation response protein AidB-like acyl-CoA dehydrogenase
MQSVAERLLSDVHELAPRIAARASEIETARRMPPDLVAELRKLGLFRMIAPKSHGGFELDYPDRLRVLAALAAVDGTAGWTVMIGGDAPLFFSRLRRELFDRIYAAGPDVILAGSFTPVGTAEPTDGGYRVSGRWPFASGCQHADWILGVAVLKGSDLPPPGAPPPIRFFVLPAHEWQIEDTWHASGLRGTGSHHIKLQDAYVPAEQSFDLFADPSCIPGPLYAVPGRFIPLGTGAVAVGIAEGAITDLVNLASAGKRHLFGRTGVRESPVFQYELGQLEADVRAARALLESQAASHWRQTVAGRMSDFMLDNEGFQANAWVAATCARAVDKCYTLGGGSAVYESSPLQRRLRDVHAVTQHVTVHQRHYAAAGAMRLGLPVGHPLFGG